MSKRILIQSILSAVKSHPKVTLTQKAASDIVDTVFSTISKQLQSTGRVRTSLGTFRVDHRPSRNYRNPRTQEVVKAPPKNVLRFKPSKRAREDVQNFKGK